MNLRDFIKKYKKQIDTLRFEEIYRYALVDLYGFFQIGQLTSMFYKIQVNPLNYLKEVPEHFLSSAEDIRSFTIPGHIDKINDYAFENCKDLSKVNMLYGITYIGLGAFINCSSLKSIIIPDSVTEINSRAFYGCVELTNVIIGNSKKHFHSEIFKNCYKLDKITFLGTMDQWKNMELEYAWDAWSRIKAIQCNDGEIKL